MSIVLLMILISFAMVGPFIVLIMKGMGMSSHKDGQDLAKKYYILAFVYLLISFGTCGSIMEIW